MWHHRGGLPKPQHWEVQQLVEQQYGLLTPERISAMAVTSCLQPPAADGSNLADTIVARSMGTNDRSYECPTCHGDYVSCPKHPGKLPLWWPTNWPFTFAGQMQLRRSVCFCCASLIRPLTAEMRATLMALPANKRLAHYLKEMVVSVKDVPFCGAPVQLAERLAKYKADQLAAAEAAQKLEEDQALQAAAAEAKAAADAKAAEEAQAAVDANQDDDETDDEEGPSYRDEDDDENAEDNDDDAEKDDVEAEDLGLPDDENPDGEGNGEEGAAGEEENGGGDDEENGDPNAEDDVENREEVEDDDNNDEPADDDGGDFDDADDGDDGGDGDDDGEGGGGRKRAKKRKRAKPKASRKKKKKSKKRKIQAVRLGKSRDLPKLLAGQFDPNKLQTHGCGAPVPTLHPEGLIVYAEYKLPWEGTLSLERCDYDKRNWPKYNQWMVYKAFRAMRSEDQEALGLNWETSPPRALLPTEMFVSRLTASKVGDFNGGSSMTPDQAKKLSNGSAFVNGNGGGTEMMGVVKDDSTQEFKDVQTKLSRFFQRLDAMGIQTHEDMPSQHRTILWKIPQKKKLLKCTCPNQHFCECILKATNQTELLAKVQAYEINLAKQISRNNPSNHQYGNNKADSKGEVDQSPMPGLSVGKRNTKLSQKSIETLHNDVGVAITTMTIGEMDRKGARRSANAAANASTTTTTSLPSGPNPSAGNTKTGGSASSSSSSSSSTSLAASTKQNSWQAGANNNNASQLKERAIAYRLPGKRGRLRSNRYGKRVERNARTVAQGSDKLELYEVGCPLEITEKLTLRDTMQRYNKVFLMDLLRRGQVEYIEHQGELFLTRALNRDTFVPELGMMCARHVLPKDATLANRQPTLHIPSIQEKEIVIILTDGSVYPLRRTADTNQVVTTAFNLDYDGDEMNLHLVDDEIARTEIREIMRPEHQIRSQQGNGVIFGLVQNSRLGLFLLSEPTTWLSRRQFQRYLMEFQRFVVHTNQPKFTRMFGRCKYHMPLPEDSHNQLWSGKQLISALLPRKYIKLANGEEISIGMFYNGFADKEHPKTQPAVIRNSVLIEGHLWGKDLETSVQGNLPHVMCQDMGNGPTITWLAGMQRVANAFLMDRGHTMGPGDFEIQPETAALNRKIQHKANAWIMKHSGNYDLKQCNEDEKRIMLWTEVAHKAVVHNLLSDVKVRYEGKGCRRNGSADIIQSKSKGKASSVEFAGAEVGQQTPAGTRILGNTSHYNKTIHMPQAHGYVQQSLSEGVGSLEYRDECIGARESLVKISGSVPKIGYLQNRVARGMSDTIAKPDGSVRNCKDHIIQQQLGDDGCDPAYFEMNPLEFITPPQHASPELRRLQMQLLESRIRLYETSAYPPEHWAAPVHFRRLFQQTVTGWPNSDKGKGSILTRAECDVIVQSWRQEMESYKLLFPVTHYRYNLLQETLLLDALNPWHVVDHHQLGVYQLKFILSEIQRKWYVSQVKSGYAVGMTASQAIGEPATQMTLNSFHTAGQKQSTPPGDLLDIMLNCPRKPPTSEMNVVLNAPWNQSWANATCVANSLVAQYAWDYVKEIKVHKHNEPFPLQDREWVTAAINKLEPEHRNVWLDVPSLRIEFDTPRRLASNLGCVELACNLLFFKRGYAQINNGAGLDKTKPTSPNNKLVMYLCQTQLLMSQFSPPFQNYVQVETEIKDMLKDCLMRGIPKINGAWAVQQTRRVFDRDHKEGTKPYREVKEWMVKTSGSNYEKLTEFPAVNFSECRSSHIYEPYPILGIQAARRFLSENLEDLVRTSKSTIANHHTNLVADVMTRMGFLTPMTRNGLSNSSESPCRLLFENILENIKRFGMFSAKDKLLGVFESVISGNLPPVGVGSLKTASLPMLPTKNQEKDQAQEQEQASTIALNIGIIQQPFIFDSVNPQKECKEQSSESLETPEQALEQTIQPDWVLGMRQVACGHYSRAFFQRYVPIDGEGRLYQAANLVSSMPRTPSVKAKTEGITTSTTSTKSTTKASRKWIWQNRQTMWYPPFGQSARSRGRSTDCGSNKDPFQWPDWSSRSCAFASTQTGVQWQFVSPLHV